MSDSTAAPRRERHTIKGEIPVFDTSSNTVVGNLVNIHEEGLMLITTGPVLSADHVYQLSLRLPSEILGSSELTVGVDCLWIKTLDTGSMMQWAGCYIIDISDHALAQLKELIEHWGE